MFEGDGYKLYEKKSRHYHVEFYLNSEKDKDVIDYIISIIEKMNLKPSSYQDKRYNCKRIRVYSKELFNLISKNIELNNKSKDFLIGFVSGLIDSEGHVNLEKDYIMIVSTNKKVLFDCKDFLNSIDIKSSISERKNYKKDKLKSYRMYVSVSFKNKPNLSIKTKRLQS